MLFRMLNTFEYFFCQKELMNSKIWMILTIPFVELLDFQLIFPLFKKRHSFKDEEGE